MANFIDQTNTIQHISGSDDHDIFIIDGESADFGWGPTQDGEGIVIWSDTGFDVLHDVEEIQFSDFRLVRDENGIYQRTALNPATETSDNISSNALSDNNSSDETSDVLTTKIAGVTQYVQGTSDKDVFVIDADANGFGWGPTADGQGLVIWNGADFDIVYNVEEVRFNNLTLTLNEDGSYSATETSSQRDDTQETGADTQPMDDAASPSTDESSNSETDQSAEDKSSSTDNSDSTEENTTEETAADTSKTDQSSQEETTEEDTNSNSTVDDPLIPDELDRDGDGILDTVDIDDDNDGVLDVAELSNRGFERSTFSSAEDWQSLDITLGGQEIIGVSPVHIGHGYSTQDQHTGISFNYTKSGEGTRVQTEGPVEISLNTSEENKFVSVSFNASLAQPQNAAFGHAKALFELVDGEGNVVDSLNWVTDRSGEIENITLSGTGEDLKLRVTDQSSHNNGWSDDWILSKLDVIQLNEGEDDAITDNLVMQMDVKSIEDWKSLDISVNGDKASETNLQIGTHKNGQFTGITFNSLSNGEGTAAITADPVEVSLTKSDNPEQINLSFDVLKSWDSYSAGGDSSSFIDQLDDAKALFELVDNRGNVVDSFTWPSDEVSGSIGVEKIQLTGRGEGLFLRVTDQSDHSGGWSDDWTLGNLQASIITLEEIDTDGDGVSDHLDLDSDNDGITDNVESQSSAEFLTPSGVDANNNGLDDIYESEQGIGIVSVDSDGDGVVDRLDTNSDNDAFTDVQENGIGATEEEIAASGDRDQDGLLDVFEGSDSNDGYKDPNDNNYNEGEFSLPGDPRLNADASNADPANGLEFDFREFDLTSVEQDLEAENDTYVIAEDNQEEILDVLSNDYDPDVGDLTITEINGVAIEGTGSVFVEGVGDVSLTTDGQLQIKSDETDREDAFFDYTVMNSNGDIDKARVHIDINQRPDAINDKVATGVWYNVDKGTYYLERTSSTVHALLNDTDEEQDTLKIVDYDKQLNGFNVSFDEQSNQFTFTQTSYSNYQSQFSYTIEDEMGNRDTAIIEVFGQYYVTGSPIAIDLSGDGTIGVTGETSSRDKQGIDRIGRTVEFDIDGDGELDAIEWFDGSGDGILIDNRDGNAAQDMHGGRLFGDEGGKYNDGYEKLALLDSNEDGVLAFEELEGLEFWIDDGDAIVEDSELQSLADHGIVEISVISEDVLDDQGRTLIQSRAFTEDGSELLTEDVWFARANSDFSELSDWSSETTEIEEAQNHNMEIRFLEADYMMG